jgi:beta-N-acetylhexosaminidase
MTTDFPLPPSLDIISQLSLPQLCGQLMVVGFEGTTLPDSIAESIQAGLRGGIILFKRNLPDLKTAWRLCQDIIAAYPPGLVPFIAVDQEGGRVCRLPAPFLTLPPMRVFGQIGDLSLTHRAGAEVGRQLAALGITCNFAPVLDVDTNPNNPIIGDRSFSSDPFIVAQQAMAFAHGLQDQGVLACGKHFPGHGDTSLDSHLELPEVRKPAEELLQTEILPFREAVKGGLGSIMTAHVSYPTLDPTGTPATLSAPIITGILRKELGFDQLVFSDDLEMKGILRHCSLSTAACGVLQSGADVLLVCHTEAYAEEALNALVYAAESEPGMSMRVLQANLRFHRLRQRFPPRPQPTLENLLNCIPGSDDDSLLKEIETQTERLRHPHTTDGTDTTVAPSDVADTTSIAASTDLTISTTNDAN